MGTSTVERLLKQWRTTQSLAHKKPGGSIPIVSDEQRSQVETWIKEQPDLTQDELAQRFTAEKRGCGGSLSDWPPHGSGASGGQRDRRAYLLVTFRTAPETFPVLTMPETGDVLQGIGARRIALAGATLVPPQITLVPIALAVFTVTRSLLSLKLFSVRHVILSLLRNQALSILLVVGAIPLLMGFSIRLAVRFVVSRLAAFA